MTRPWHPTPEGYTLVAAYERLKDHRTLSGCVGRCACEEYTGFREASLQYDASRFSARAKETTSPSLANVPFRTGTAQI